MWATHTLSSPVEGTQAAQALVAVAVVAAGTGASHMVRKRLYGTGKQVAAVVLSGSDSVGRVVVGLGSVSQHGERSSGWAHRVDSWCGDRDVLAIFGSWSLQVGRCLAD